MTTKRYPTTDQINKLAELAQAGTSIRRMCEAVGIGVSTFYRWRREAEALAERQREVEAGRERAREQLDRIRLGESVEGDEDEYAFIIAELCADDVYDPATGFVRRFTNNIGSDKTSKRDFEVEGGK